MKIAVTGAYGLLGEEFMRVLGKTHEVIPFPRRQELDLTNLQEVRDFVAGTAPDLIIHSAAIRDLDPLELKPDLAWRNNAGSTFNVVQAARENDCILVQTSSDSIYTGEKTDPYHEFDPAGPPSSVYGQTKLASEMLVREQLQRCFVLRLPWLYGQTGGLEKNWILQMIKKVKTGQQVTAASDQVANVLYTTDVAETVEKMITTEYWGVYNLANQGEVSRAGFQKAVLAEAGLDPEMVLEVSIGDLKRPARRLPQVTLTSYLLEPVFGICLSHWQERLPACINNLRTSGYLG
jgi:dTDP-4-dehydrorhamnose reductase